MRSSGIILVGAKSDDKSPYKSQTRDTDTNRRTQREDRSREFSAATSQRMPGATTRQRRQGRMLSWGLWREHSPTHLVCRQNCAPRTMVLYYCSPGKRTLPIPLTYHISALSPALCRSPRDHMYKNAGFWGSGTLSDEGHYCNPND